MTPNNVLLHTSKDFHIYCTFKENCNSEVMDDVITYHSKVYPADAISWKCHKQKKSTFQIITVGKYSCVIMIPSDAWANASVKLYTFRQIPLKRGPIQYIKDCFEFRKCENDDEIIGKSTIFKMWTCEDNFENVIAISYPITFYHVKSQEIISYYKKSYYMCKQNTENGIGDTHIIINYRKMCREEFEQYIASTKDEMLMHELNIDINK